MSQNKRLTQIQMRCSLSVQKAQKRGIESCTSSHQTPLEFKILHASSVVQINPQYLCSLVEEDTHRVSLNVGRLQALKNNPRRLLDGRCVAPLTDRRCGSNKERREHDSNQPGCTPLDTPRWPVDGVCKSRSTRKQHKSSD
jgi:hypothetical protein